MFAVSRCLLVLLFGVLTESRNTDYEGKIIGGEEWENNTLAKHIVSIRYIYGDQHMCGGSILNNLLILTAAHCLINVHKNPYDPLDLNIVAGKIYRDKYEDTMQGRSVKEFFIHKNYKNKDIADIADIALILLNKGLIENGVSVQRIPLASKPPKADSQYMAYGWGRIYEDGPASQKVSYVLFGKKHYTNCNGYSTMPSKLLCFKGNKYGVCKGDSGGPLTSYPGPFELFGVSSTSSAPCGTLSIFTSIHYYRNWIDYNVKKHTRLDLNDAKTQTPSILLVLIAYFHIV